MNDSVYFKLAKFLDTHPSGFPATEDGLEIKLLKEIFTSEEADLCCDLKITAETAEEISKRTGRSLEGLEEMLLSMVAKGQIGVEQRETGPVFRMIPWVVGIFEAQGFRVYPRLAELMIEYNRVFTPQFLKRKPHFMQVIPIEEEIASSQEAMPYEFVSEIIEKGQDFFIMECVCKKTMIATGNDCDHLLERCLGISEEPGRFNNSPIGRQITKAEAYEVLKKAEDDALVHMVNNTTGNHAMICNCCGCCCGVLKPINESKLLDSLNTHYYAVIDAEKCESCGVCAKERCQVNAVELGEFHSTVVREKCIGCGLCVQTCKTEAISLIRKNPEDQVEPCADAEEWFEKRTKNKSQDISALI